MVVHRPAYDDWTLPKGKAHANELLPSTAIREVGEESGVRVRLSCPLAPLRYPIGQTMKFVSWWVGPAQSWCEHRPNSEVDLARWMPVDKALATMTYSDERAILTEAVALPDTTPLILIRHAKAMRRAEWTKDDALRPLSSRGHEQLPFVAQILKPFGVSHCVSSSSTRCVQTLRGYAKSAGIKVGTQDCLSEQGATRSKVSSYVTRLARAVGASGTPAAVCSHLPVVQLMCESLDIPVHPMATASCVIAHLDRLGTVVRTEWHDTLRVKL